MLTKVWKFLVFILAILYPSQAFWWGTATTEATRSLPPVMKQIPLTYFRTYTYQQPIGNNQLQLPLLSSTDYVTNNGILGTSPYFNPMLPMMSMPIMPMPLTASNDIPLEARPGITYASPNQVRSLNNIVPAFKTTTKPESTTITSTTTTTTTPAPTTTTTTTTEAPTTVQESAITSVPLIKTDSLINIESAYPAFNRKVFTNHFNINYNRPAYPFPEYTIQNPKSSNVNDENTNVLSNVEFVPCMCPVNMQKGGLPAAFQASQPLGGNPSNSIFLAQGRTNSENDDSLDPPVAEEPINVDVNSKTEDTNLVDDLQVVKLDGEEEKAAISQNV